MYFRIIAKAFDSPFSGGYKIREHNVVLKAFDKFPAIANSKLWSSNYLKVNSYENIIDKQLTLTS